MTAYRLSNLINTYDVVDLNVVTLAEALSKNSQYEKSKLIKMLRNHTYDNLPLKEIWPEEVPCNYFGGARKQDYDITLLSDYLVLKMDVVDVLKDELTQSGELLPINVEGTKMMLFNCLTFGKEEDELCIRRYEDGIQYGLETLSFDAEDIKNKAFFKSKLDNAQFLYCSETVKTLLEEHNFKGLTFDTNLLCLDFLV